MFKNAKAQRYFLGFGTALTLTGVVALPASAQFAVAKDGGITYYRRNHNPTVSNFIYGSPISTPVPVNPATGHIPIGSSFSKPYRKKKVYNSKFINPILVNPIIIKDSRRRNRQPNSRIIINNRW
ncbi:MAG: hypothetical protein AAF915_15215 [Cyanobacteria bacterium P01_D01_bin.50]